MTRGTEVLPIADHGQSGSTDRAAEIEGEDLIVGIPPELQRHQRQQHRLAGSSGADDEGVADIADMKRQAERGGAFGPCMEQGGRSEERRVGKEWVSTCRTRGSRYH